MHCLHFLLVNLSTLHSYCLLISTEIQPRLYLDILSSFAIAALSLLAFEVHNMGPRERICLSVDMSIKSDSAIYRLIMERSNFPNVTLMEAALISIGLAPINPSWFVLVFSKTAQLMSTLKLYRYGLLG